MKVKVSIICSRCGDSREAEFTNLDIKDDDVRLKTGFKIYPSGELTYLCTPCYEKVLEFRKLLGEKLESFRRGEIDSL